MRWPGTAGRARADALAGDREQALAHIERLENELSEARLDAEEHTAVVEQALAAERERAGALAGELAEVGERRDALQADLAATRRDLHDARASLTELQEQADAERA